MNKKNEIVLVDEKYLESKIYIIRGQKVMLDRDLAEIYGYSTKRFNEQVQRNIEKFEEDFMFQLTEDEATSLSRCQFGTSKGNKYDDSSRSQNVTLNDEDQSYSLRCKNFTLKEDGYDDSSRSQIATLNISNNKRGFNIKYRPYAFSESGIYMLMTVLKGPLATKQSIALIRLFRSMKDYLVENRNLLPAKELELRTTILEKDVQSIKQDNKTIKMDLKKVMNNFIDPSTYKHFLILDGKKLEADIAYKNIFKLAKHSIIYIDNYIGLKTLELLSYASKGVSITIFSDNKSKPALTKTMIDDFNTQNSTNKLSLYKPSFKFHDRYIIIDHNTKKETIYHCGSSLKDSGSKISTITKLEMPILYKTVIDDLLKKGFDI